jgi:hypothetical protein
MKKYFKNRHGKIANGTKVRFEMENADMWSGDIDGILTYKGKKWVIETKYSGTIQINEWLGAYGETIEPI